VSDQEVLNSHVKFKEIQSLLKKAKKILRNAGGDNQSAGDIKKYPSQVQYPSYREEEDLVDYEPESPERYPTEEDDISEEFDELPAHGDGPAANSPKLNDIPAF
jgi:hypothetical protein